tara:strand:+ start:753 stop:1226 length:474 start_codon:yes stop_codon:yes gene_type:complete
VGLLPLLVSSFVYGAENLSWHASGKGGTVVAENPQAISVAGGDLQDQTTLNCLLNVIEFGMDPKQAVSCARFSTRHYENSFNPARTREIYGLGHVTLQSTVRESIVRNLSARGHRVVEAEGAIAAPVMLFLDRESELLHAAGDPRAGRHAAVHQPVE